MIPAEQAAEILYKRLRDCAPEEREQVMLEVLCRGVIEILRRMEARG
ncbi:MAG: hypothetical protein QN174_07685 [Armatimonadota bacterium]|nr:hypothetical protein [Armatimonadota bacterium]